jgi:hypothetical protein
MLFRWAQGRPEEPEDQAVIDGASERYRDSGFRFRELILAIAGTLAKEETGTEESQAGPVLR